LGRWYGPGVRWHRPGAPLFASLLLLGCDTSRQPQPIEAEAGTRKPAQHVAAGGEAAQGMRHGMNVLFVHNRDTSWFSAAVRPRSSSLDAAI